MQKVVRRPAHPLRKALGLSVRFVFVFSQWMSGYSMLTHEQIVDLAWSDQIQPLLKQRLPKATEEELNEAHAYAYGGCIIQDLGYYPFGNKDSVTCCTMFAAEISLLPCYRTPTTSMGMPLLASARTLHVRR